MEKNSLYNINRIFLALLVVLTCVLYSHALLFAEVSLDAGYYLGLAQQIVGGKLLYKDIINNYSPLSMYYFAIVMVLFGDNYAVILLFLFVVIFAGAFFIYKCSYKITSYRLFSFLLSCLFLVSSYYYDASYIYLEPFVNLFGIASVYCLIKWEKNNRSLFLFLSGLFAVLAFLSKQYGIIYIVFSGFFTISVILYSSGITLKSILKSFVFLFLGGLIPFFLLLLVYYNLGVRPEEFVDQLIVKTYADESFTNYLESTGSFLLHNGLVLILAPFVFFLKQANTDAAKLKIVQFLVLLLFLTSVYYVKVFSHYSMLLLPANFLAIGAVYVNFIKAKNEKWFQVFYIIFWISIALISVKSIEGFIKNLRNWDRRNQLAIAAEINKIVYPQSKVLVLSDYHFYYMCRFNPYLPEKYGYSFFGGLLPDQQKELLNEAKVIFLHKDYKGRYLKQIDEYNSVINISDLLIIRK